MIRKILFAFSLLFCSVTAASAATCPSASSSTTITNSCTTGLIWTGGNLTIGTSSSSISITNTLDVAVIEANNSSLGILTNNANNIIGDGSTGNAIQNDSGSFIRRIYNYGTLTAENGVWNDGSVTTLYNYGAISSTNGGIWNNSGSINAVYNAGSITVGSGDNGVYNNALISTFNNSGSITVGDTGTAIAIGGSGIITTLNNSGSMTVGSASGGGSWGISNGGIISTLNNSGSINLLDDGYGISNANVITTLNNSGTIDVATGKGIWNISGATITTLNNSGTIDAGGGDILNQGTLITLNNYAFLTGTNVGVNNTGNLTTFNNRNSINITSTDSGVGVANSGTFTTLNNLGSIIVAGTNANAVSNAGTLNTLNNYGNLTVSDATSYTIYNSGSITTLDNSGSINNDDAGTGIYNDGSATISTLTNTGSITVGTGGIGINNGGTITTLNNSQGGDGSSAATTALSFTGNSPTNYNIGIISQTHYGKLLMDAGATITNVGIYGTPLVTSRTYTGVLANDVTVTNMQNEYDNMTVALVNNVATSSFDLTFAGVSRMGTQLSLNNNAAALIPIYTMQNAILVNSFTYDCNQFDSRNFCISAAGRNSKVSSAGGLSDSSAILIAAYRPHPNYRIGAYIDQNLSLRNEGSTVNLDNNIPVIGLFAVWNQRKNGTAAEIKLSAAYGQKNVTINRQTVGLSEFGSGSSTLDSQGAQLTAKYGFGLSKDFIISPYVGLRHTQNNMSGYTENNSSSLTAPLTYNSLNTSTTTALTGLSASYRFIPKAVIFASAGLETALNTASSQYLATSSGISGLTPVNFNPNPNKTRRTAILGASYNLGKNQQVGIAGIYRQEAVRKIDTTTVMLTYAVGL